MLLERSELLIKEGQEEAVCVATGKRMTVPWRWVGPDCPTRRSSEVLDSPLDQMRSVRDRRTGP